MEIRRRERLLVLLAVICFAVMAGDKLVFSPLLELWKKRSARITELENSLSTGRILVDREAIIRERWQDMNQRGLPVEESVAENRVLQAMNRWSQESRLGVSSLKPRWVSTEQGHKTLECRVAAQGDMGALVRFLYELERDPLALHVEEIEVTSRDDGGRNLSLGVQFSGLVLKGDEP